MTLNFSSLEKSLKALEKSIASYNSRKTEFDEDILDTLRAGVIHNFEVAYEQCWKFVQRWLRENRTVEEANHSRTRKELFRMAARYGLITDPLPWFDYGDARNLTTHTYDEEQAETVFNTACSFLPDAWELLAAMRHAND